MSTAYIVNPSTVYNGGAVTGGISNSGTITLTNTGAGSSHTVLGSGGAGSTMISTGAGLSYNNATTSWQMPNTSTNFSASGKTVMSIPADGNSVVLEPSATLDVQGNIVMNGVDLEERLKTIETRLQIPTRDAIMEAKHPKLAELYKEYMKELEKYKTWDRIKGEE